LIDRAQREKDRVGGVELGAFRVVRLLASGSFATAYLTEQVSTGEPAVLKVAHADLFLGSRADELRRRFEAEARAASRVRHACLPRIFAAGNTLDGIPAIAMEYVEGPSLSAVLTRRQDVDLDFIDRCFTGLAHTLRTIHDVGIVHRDVTPKNVVWSPGRGGDYRPVLLDFGVARLDNRSLGTIGAMGTPGYMPPEQLFGRAVPRSDVYALGAIFWWACTGRSFLSYFDDVEDLMAYQMGDRAPPNPMDENPGLPADLADLLVWMLEPDASSRPSPEQFIDTWHAILPSLRGRWTPPSALEPAAKANTDEDGPMDLEIATEFAGAHYHRAAQVSVTIDDANLLRLTTAYLRGGGHVVEVSNSPTATRSDGLESASVFIIEAGLLGLDAEELAAGLKAEAPTCSVVLVHTRDGRVGDAPSADATFELPRELMALAEHIHRQLEDPAAEPSTWLPMPLNRETIARLAEGSDPSLVAGRIDLFVDEFPTWLEGLVRSVGAHAWPEARTTCANISHTASSLGADRLADLAQVVHSLAGHDAQMAQRILDELQSEFGRVRQALRLTRAQFLRPASN
jgi:serine/threonine protein kinase